MSEEIKKTYSHYYKECPFTHVDVYRVLQLFAVSDPCLQHAIKKLLAVGRRGAKDADKDVREAIFCLERWVEMRQEEDLKRVPPKLVSIRVNGLTLSSKIIKGETIHYDEIIRWCGIDRVVGSPVHTVSSTNLLGGHGDLSPGCSVIAESDMSFIVSRI